MVTYKTVPERPADPSGATTSTWRDPAGPNRPENELLGQMYIGDNDPRRTSRCRSRPPRAATASGATRRAARRPPAPTVSIGIGLVGWEWDARVANGAGARRRDDASPPRRSAATSSRTTAQLHATAPRRDVHHLQGRQRRDRLRDGHQQLVARPRAPTSTASGEPDSRIQQATINVLSDMGVRAVDARGRARLDPSAPPWSSSTRRPATAPRRGADGHASSATFDRPLDPATVDDADLTLTPVERRGRRERTLDDATPPSRSKPDALDPFRSYTATTSAPGLTSWTDAAGGGP